MKYILILTLLLVVCSQSEAKTTRVYDSSGHYQGKVIERGDRVVIYNRTGHLKEQRRK